MRHVALRLLLPLWLLLSLAPAARAQTVATDSLRLALSHALADSSRVLLLLKLASTYRSSKPDSTLELAQQACELARQVSFVKGQGRAQGMIGSALRERGELPKAFANQIQAYQISRQCRDLQGQAYSLNGLGNIRFDLQQYRQALDYYRQSKEIYTRLHLMPWVAGTLTSMGSCYEKLNVLDSALILQSQAAAVLAQTPRPRLASAALALRNMGALQARLGNYPAAFSYYRQALQETGNTNDLRNRAMAQCRMAGLYHTLHQPDSSLLYARLALHTAAQVSYRTTILEASNLLTQLHRVRHNVDSAFYYQSLAVTMQDSLFGPEKFQQLQLLAFSEQQRQQQQREAQELKTTSYQRFALLVALGFILTVALLLGWANRQHRRANHLLNERNQQIEAQRNALNEALTELRAAQAQLVATEKWAFVGELSAGIAHELQNPLAFMKNFADVSVGLLDHDGSPRPQGLEGEIMAGLRKNLREISQHGQRASSIIADMLAHARTGTSQRESTDLNTLVTNNLQLAILGNSEDTHSHPVHLETDLAPDLPSVLAAPQELGRVLLNLFTNALYATRRRQQSSPPDYQPQVQVRTRRMDHEVEIRVRDNGTGMPATVAAQVFEPFFTTKPTGEGTGLGLSLAHDIITKGHGGTLTVETEDGKFTEFTVRLPA
ncbi:ATP-binding protein [Hymenobacter negativus]|uniref:histidine kinase n=1 Tax=Hymenobacter negativus TaxID=2795026 RepID=A0ABS3QBE9_9BACT|nr:ATP-binding protein [Hymenobacter negativus]MBO2008577.1 tetratricopeptide repeat protein [Hymenobacter negativus]